MFRSRIDYLIDRALRGPIFQENNLKNKLACCGQNVRIRMPSVIEHPELVTISEEVSVAPFLHIWGNGGVEIGARTMIASHVAITSATHDPYAANMSQSLIVAPVFIDEDVWIGSHSVILPGVSIGRNSIVAAGSIVRRDVLPNSVVGGAPAKLIRERIKGE